MKLYYAEVLNPRKVCALARYLGAPIDYHRINLAKGEHKQPAFTALNPNGRVPVLEDGDNVLWESDAILCYLARRSESDLWPLDDRQADVLRWLSWNQVHFQPAGGVFYFERVIKATFKIGPPNEEKIAKVLPAYQNFARVLNDHLAGRQWLLGDAMSIADFSVAAVLPFAAQAGLPLDSCPAILRWHDRLNAIDAWREPYPSAA